MIISIKKRKTESAETEMESSSPSEPSTNPTTPANNDPVNDDTLSVQSKTLGASLHGLSPDEKSRLLAACVGLVAVPVEADALNAVLRLCLRLTQEFEQAVQFAKLGGIKLLLNLKQVRK